jgi:hypothetical protein
MTRARDRLIGGVVRDYALGDAGDDDVPIRTIVLAIVRASGGRAAQWFRMHFAEDPPLCQSSTMAAPFASRWV